MVSGEDKLWGILSYLGILCLLPLLLKRDNSFAQFHSKQGLVMLIIGIALGVLGIPMALLMLIPVVGAIIGVLWGIVVFVIWIGMLILWIMAIIKVLQGKTWKMPIIGGYAERIKF